MLQAWQTSSIVVVAVLLIWCIIETDGNSFSLTKMDNFHHFCHSFMAENDFSFTVKNCAIFHYWWSSFDVFIYGHKSKILFRSVSNVLCVMFIVNIALAVASRDVRIFCCKNQKIIYSSFVNYVQHFLRYLLR